MTAAHLGTPTFFLEDLDILRGLFETAEMLDDWDSAREAFRALLQNAWAAHVQIVGDAPLRCPLLDDETTETEMVNHECRSQR